MRIAVISGGGGIGALTIPKFRLLNKKYNYIIGVSTGAVMAPLVAIGDEESHAKLEQAYTTTTNKDIFNKYPFNKKGQLSILNAVWRSIIGKVSVGEMEPLVSLVKKWFTPNDWKKLQECGTIVIIAILNVTTGRVEYKQSNEIDYEDFCKYTAYACSPELLGTLFEDDGWEYSDSGLANLVPIIKATKVPNLKECDIFMHREYARRYKNSKPLLYTPSWLKPFRILKAIYRYVTIQREYLEHIQLREGVLRCLLKGVEPTVYYIDGKFKNVNPMVMDKGKMKEMYDYSYAQFGITDIKHKYTLSNWEQLFDINDDE